MTTHVVTDEQLGIYARREHDLFRRIREGTLPVEQVLEGLQSLIEGNFNAVQKSPHHIIDCDADQFIPDDDWTVEAHRKGGQWKWDPSKVKLHLVWGQGQGSTASGHKLRRALKSQSVLNACVLDYLLAHPELIPEEWKGKHIFFWGTIYRHSDGHLCVRCIDWDGSGWGRNYAWLADDWDFSDPAAVRAS